METSQCCLCGQLPAPFNELRPTGRDNRPQCWHFCPSCWRELEGQRANQAPEHILRSALFFRFIAGDPRLAGWRPLDSDIPAAPPADMQRTDIPLYPDMTPAESA